MDPVTRSGERNRLLGPMQRLHMLGMDEVDLAHVLVVSPSAHVRLEASNDHGDQLLGLLEGAIGVSRLRWRR
jgi:hypothetical protein